MEHLPAKKPAAEPQEPAQKQIAFFSYGILEQGGGFENYLIDTSHGLAERYPDLHVSIITMDPATVERLQHLLSFYFMRKQEAKAIYRESSDSVRQRLGAHVDYVQAANIRDLAAKLCAQDLIYAKNEVLELSVLQRIGWKRLPPVIIGVHTPIHYPSPHTLSARLHNVLYGQLLYGWLIRNVAKVHVNNAADRELVQQMFGSQDVQVVRQAFDLPERGAPPVADGERLRLLSIGRLSEQKGIGLLVEIAKMLQAAWPDAFELTIAGSGEPAAVAQIEQLSRQLPWVQYVGHVPNDQVDKLYGWADVTIIPSTYETLSKVAIETATAQKVAVSTDVAGPREIIENERTGFLLPSDPEHFVSCLMKLAALKRNDPSRLRAMGQAAYDCVRARFSPAVAYGQLYQDFISMAKG